MFRLSGALALALIMTNVWSEVMADPGRAFVDGDTPPPSQEPGGLRFGWEEPPASSPFREGSWVAMTYGSYIDGSHDDRVRMYNLHVGGGYYFLDNVSFNLQASGYLGTHLATSGSPNDEGGYYGGSVEGLLRCHVAFYGPWSVYVDGGSGVSQMSTSVPTGGTHFNFVLTAGVGGTYQLDESSHLMAGYRWFHLSNGNFFNDPNPGLDAGQWYAGLLFKY